MLYLFESLSQLLRPTEPPDHARRLAYLSEGTEAEDTRIGQLLYTPDPVLVQQGQDHLTGFQANLAAQMALHNFCIWFNKSLG
jgi:hypothetical protein